MYRTPIKSKNQNKTSMIKAMEPFRDSQTWYSGYRIGEVSACLRGTKAVLFRPAKFFLEALFARADNVTLSPLLLQ
jgi:hypothetical protein